MNVFSIGILYSMDFPVVADDVIDRFFVDVAHRVFVIKYRQID